MLINKQKIKEIFLDLNYLRNEEIMLRLRSNHNELGLPAHEAKAIFEFVNKKNKDLLIKVLNENESFSSFFRFWLSRFVADQLKKKVNKTNDNRDLWIFLAIDYAINECGLSLTQENEHIFEIMAEHLTEMGERKRTSGGFSQHTIRDAYYKGKFIYDSFLDKAKVKKFFQPLQKKSIQ